LQFTGYRYCGEKAEDERIEIDCKKGMGEELHTVSFHKHHTLLKPEKTRKPRCNLILQWKNRGGTFTCKRHENVNYEQTRNEKDAAPSQFHRMFAIL
jgi:hypothetical protein